MDEDYQQSAAKKVGKQHNTLPLWGNEATMNLNPLILANIQGSSYFKVHLFKLKTYHEVVDEIYYQVKHMEPWERGSRKTSGQTGMCGGVRGVGAGGIVSTAYCLLYKLYTLRLTRKQVNGLLNHTDSPYIRALGFMYLRYTQPPADLYDWYEDYLQDEEEIDVKAGGGQVITVGQMVYQFLTKLDWFSTLFPRIPVPIQKQIEKRLEQYCRDSNISLHQLSSAARSNAAGAGAGVAAASVGGGGGAAYDCDDAGYERRSGGGSGGGVGVVGAGSSRDVYVGRSAVPPTASSYRDEHDDRERSSSAYRHRRREESPSNECHSSRDRERTHQHHHREKHKKKHKHKHHSRSRSRSHSRGRSARKREREREREWAHEREQRDKERDRDRDRDYERRVRESDERRFR